MSMKLTSGIFVLVLSVFSCNGLGYAQKTPQTKDTSKKAGSTNQATYSPNDVIASKVTGTDLLDIKTDDDNKKIAVLFDEFIAAQSNGGDLLKSIPPSKPEGGISDKDAIVIHAVMWGKSSSNGYRPTKGAWAFYRVDKQGNLKQDHDLSGTPYLYNAPHIYFVDLNYFPDKLDSTNASFAYTITTTPRQKQNESDFATLVSSLLKVSPAQASKAEVEVKPSPQVWGTSTTVKASSPIPYDLAITATVTTLKDPKTYISCDPSPCSFSKTVTHYDPEYWDVSLGASIPGVLEPKYSSTGTLASPTRHTDAYAFLDLYPLQHFANAPTSLTSIPHFNLGIPITSQSLHRPYVGVAENLGFLTKKIKLNIPLSVFAGPVFMKQQVYVPTIPGLRWDHATKMMYGLELPISAITKYMKGGSSSSNGGKSGSSNNSGS
jgi:hypothetical protein